MGEYTERFAQLLRLHEGGSGMTPIRDDPPDTLPPELQRAALRAVQRTDRFEDMYSLER